MRWDGASGVTKPLPDLLASCLPRAPYLLASAGARIPARSPLVSIGTIVASRTGFFFGWWIVFASAASVSLTGGPFFCGFSPLFDPLIAEFGWSRAATSFAFSLRSEVGGIAAPAVGLLVDRVGSRRVMVVGVLAVALGFVLLSRVQDLWG